MSSGIPARPRMALPRHPPPLPVLPIGSTIPASHRRHEIVPPIGGTIPAGTIPAGAIAPACRHAADRQPLHAAAGIPAAAGSARRSSARPAPHDIRRNPVGQRAARRLPGGDRPGQGRALKGRPGVPARPRRALPPPPPPPPLRRGDRPAAHDRRRIRRRYTAPAIAGTIPGQPAPKAARPPIRIHKRPRTPNAHACTSPRFPGSKFPPPPPFFTCWRKTRRSNGGSRRHRRRIRLNGMTAVSKTAGCKPTGVRIPHPGRTVQPYKHRRPPVRLAARQSDGESAAAAQGPPPREGQGRSALPQPSGDRRAAWKGAPRRPSQGPGRALPRPPGTVPGDCPAPCTVLPIGSTEPPANWLAAYDPSCSKEASWPGNCTETAPAIAGITPSSNHPAANPSAPRNRAA